MSRSFIASMLLVFLFELSTGQTLTSFTQGKLDETLDSCEKNFEEASVKKDPEAIFHWLTGIFDVYRQKGDYDKSFFYARKLVEVGLHTGNPEWMFVADWCLAEVYAQEGNFADALTYYRQASTLPKTKKGIDPDASFQLEWAEAYSQVNQFDSAWRIYAEFRRVDDTTRPVYLVSTGECLYQNGKFQQALDNFQAALKGYRETNNTNGLTRTYPDIARTFLALGDTKAALQYSRLGLETALNSKANPYIRDNYFILSNAYAKSNRRDSANEYFVKYSLVKEAILNDIVKAKFAAYRFEEKIAAIDRQRQGLIIGCIALALLTLAIIGIANLNRKNEARKRLLAETELELKALRARMDPHFIFNCLNSILRFIVNNDTKQAADYLTKFAKLMRLVLESSAHSFIPLEEELTILKIYLTLENLRFEKHFSWHIDTEGIDTSAILVPTLLMQPFVENAIWHGLHPLAEPGTITIRLRLHDQTLHCEIEDNGVGRKHAAVETSKNPMGIALTTQRLQRIHPQSPNPITIHDLTDETGKNTGTRVRLAIPVKPA